MSKFGKRRSSFSSLLRNPEKLRTPMSYDNSFIDLNEDRRLSPRKYREQMKLNRLKVTLRQSGDT